jgi:hypothetical protein
MKERNAGWASQILNDIKIAQEQRTTPYQQILHSIIEVR